MVSYRKFLKWAAQHHPSLPRLHGLAREVQDANSPAERWAVLKALGDALLEIVGDFDSEGAEGFDTEAGLALEIDFLSDLAGSLDLDDVRYLYVVCRSLIPTLLRVHATPRREFVLRGDPLPF